MPFRFLDILIFASFFISTAFAGEGKGQFDWVKPGENVHADRLIVEIAPEYAPLKIESLDGEVQTSHPHLNKLLKKFAAAGVEKMFHMKETPKDPKVPDLSRFYYIYLPKAVDLQKALNAFNRCPGVELAEPTPINRTYYTPNDPRFINQWHLDHSGFPEAWNLTRGNAEIVIGIVDSGLDMDIFEDGTLQVHEDLYDNLWVNPGEDIDGDGRITIEDWNDRDDDGNGFTDDFHGWDIVGRHNWPDEFHGAEGGHGTFVAGIAAGVADNETGVASASFSCRIMVAGCAARGNPRNIDRGYEGIEYCALNSADVINCSWGALQAHFAFGQRVIDYARSQGSIVFAAVGNDGVNDRAQDRLHHYPAAFDGVIGVGATNRTDRRAVWNPEESSNYGDYTDICAPGDHILTTFPRNSYTADGGTSAASPLAAGLGALMLSITPDLDTEQLLEWMQRTAVDISDLNENYPGIEKRINADFLINSTRPKLDVLAWTLNETQGNRNGRAEWNETVEFILTIGNIAGYVDATNIRARLETQDPDIRIDRGEVAIGDLNDGEQVVLDDPPFQFYVRMDDMVPHYSSFNVVFEADGGYARTVEIPMIIGHPPYLLVDDDDGDNYEDFYIADLAVRPHVHEVWSIAERGVPTLNLIWRYGYLIWETGEARSPLTDDETALLRVYLDQGGSLILSSQFAGDEHGGSDFFRDYLHARHTNDRVAEAQLNGVEGTMTEGLSALLVGGGGAGNSTSPSAMDPLDGAHAIFTFARSGEVGGIYYNGGEDGYRVVYLGFPLEAATGLANTTPRQELVARILEQVYTDLTPRESNLPVPASFGMSSPWPNPFNSRTALTVNLPARTAYQLDVLDASGRVVDKLFSGVGAAGVHRFEWHGKQVPTGVYFIRLGFDGGSVLKKASLVR